MHVSSNKDRTVSQRLCIWPVLEKWTLILLRRRSCVHWNLRRHICVHTNTHNMCCHSLNVSASILFRYRRVTWEISHLKTKLSNHAQSYNTLYIRVHEVKALFYPMFPDFRNNIGFYKVPRLHLFVLLVRATWRWIWVWALEEWYCQGKTEVLGENPVLVPLSSSSLGATTSIFECFGFLNIRFPIFTILDAVSPILYFQFLHIISYAIFPSVLWSP
jgi:hypothetical protein